MNASTSPSPLCAPAKRPRRRWLRGLLLLLALAILGPALMYGYVVLSTRSAWEAAEEEASRLDPRWKLLEMEADRPQLPDAENSALFTIAVHRKIKGGGVRAAPHYELIFKDLPPNVQLNQQQLQAIRGELAKIAKPLTEARKLKDMPNGRFSITYSDDWFMTLYPDRQEVRNLGDWLSHDAYELAHDDKPDEALESCRALLNAGRSMNGETSIMLFLIRGSMQTVSVSTLERVLAQGEPSDASLQAIQSLVELEMKESGWLQAVRGERAGAHHLFENVRAGVVPPATLRNFNGGPVHNTNDVIVRLVPSTMLQYYPEHLRYMTRCVEIAKLPLHERGPKLKEWEDDVGRSENPVIRSITPALGRWHEWDCRMQALLRSTLVALACERYRQMHGDWPATLDLLVKAKLLDALPTDPMDNQPLRYRRTKDGVVIYSIGIDGIDNHGAIDRNWPNAPNIDVGFRLWDVDRRRQSPLPPVVLPDGK